MTATPTDSLRRDFVANVSHELRTPVAVIQANAETLLCGALADPVSARRFVEAIARASTRLTELISDLLDLSRIETGNYGLTLGPRQVERAVERAVEHLTEPARQQGVRVVKELEPGLTVVADKRGLDQVLINLLDNAIKHSPPAGTITVRSKAEALGVRIELEDQGPGVAPQYRDRVFERFFRVDHGRSRDKGGTGLGLAIVKHLTGLMHGQVGVKSGKDGGALFWLVLPGTEALPQNVGPPVADATPKPPNTSPEDEAHASELRRLRKRLVRMSSRIERMIDDAAAALSRGDLKLAKRTIKRDQKVNRAEVKSDFLCGQILARHRLKPEDLRFVTVALKIVTDLERIGDLTVSICRQSLENAQPPPGAVAIEMQQLATLARRMVRNAIDAFVDADLDKALSVVALDDGVDASYHAIADHLRETMRAEVGRLDEGLHLLFAAKAMERIGDHATNIAEQVVFLVEGNDIRHRGKGR